MVKSPQSSAGKSSSHQSTTSSRQSSVSSKNIKMNMSKTLSVSSSSCTKKSIRSEESNNVIIKSNKSSRHSVSSSSTSGSSLTSHTSGSYSLDESDDSISFRYDSGYDPWQKLSLHGYNDFDPSKYDQTRVIKKKASDRKASMAYSISPENSTENTVLKAGSEESDQSSASSPSAEPDYDGMYEKAMDEKLELEFDDDLELFETIENGIHGTTDFDTSTMCNASYNRDINTWRQYSGVSMETISDDLWSDFLNSHSAEDILNDNFVIPLMQKAKQLSNASGSANNTNYHWRTHIEP